MPIVKLYVNGDISTGWTTFGGTGTEHWTKIEEALATPDDTDGILTSSSGAIDTLDLETVSDFGSLNALYVQGVRLANSSKWSDDGHALRVRLLKADSTELTNVSNNVTSASFHEINAWGSYTGTLTQAEVDGLRIEFQFTLTAVGMADGASLQISTVEVEIDYNVAASTRRIFVV